MNARPVFRIKGRGVTRTHKVLVFGVPLGDIAAGVGTQPPTPRLTLLAQIFTVVYFAYFLLMPFYSKIDKAKPPPLRVTE